jgi:hypothetical protein
MIDCSKGLSDLTPYETYRCFIEADDWKIVGRNLERMWSDFTGTTNGGWAEIVFAFALIPAQIASYILPFYFVNRMITRVRGQSAIVSGERERRRKIGWGSYLIVCGAALMFQSGNHDRLLLFQGAWEAICGITTFILASSWWAPASQFALDDARTRRASGPR